MTKTRKIHPWRRFVEIVQAVVIIGIPFINIKGESALRFDVPTLQLHFFGLNLWMEEFFIVLVAIIFLSLLIIFITLLLGRIWCGWVCPQTVISDFTAFVDRVRNKGFLHKSTAYLSTLLISIVVAANLIWYFVSPYAFFPGLLGGNLGNVTWGFWLVLTGILFLNFLLLRQKFCATVCPYAKLQSTLFDSKTLIVAFDPRRKEECINCMACVKTCPVGIDIRNGLDIACIHCAECIDQCTDVMKQRQKSSLIGYFFGLPGEGGRIFRQNAVLIGSVTVAFLIFFFYLLIMRVTVDMTVLPNYAFPPRMSERGAAVNAYILSVKNRGKTDAELEIEAVGIRGVIKIIPDRVIRVKAGEMKKVPLYISIKNFIENDLTHNISIRIQSIKSDKLVIEKKAKFIIPGKR